MLMTYFFIERLAWIETNFIQNHFSDTYTKPCLTLFYSWFLVQLKLIDSMFCQIDVNVVPEILCLFGFLQLQFQVK